MPDLRVQLERPKPWLRSTMGLVGVVSGRVKLMAVLSKSGAVAALAGGLIESEYRRGFAAYRALPPRAVYPKCPEPVATCASAKTVRMTST